MIRQRDYLRKKANKTGSNILRQAFQQIKNKVTYTIRKLRAEYYSKTLKKNEGDLKKTWIILKQAMCKDTKTTKIDHININDTIINDKQKISEELNDHFVSNGEKLANEIQPSKNTPEYYLFKTKRNGTNFKFRNIRPNQIVKLLTKLKNGKASGIDMMSNKFIKVARNIIAPSLCDIFNSSIEKKVFPHDFKIAVATPSLRVVK